MHSPLLIIGTPESFEGKEYNTRHTARAVLFREDGKIAILHVGKYNYHKLSVKGENIGRIYGEKNETIYYRYPNVMYVELRTNESIVLQIQKKIIIFLIDGSPQKKLSQLSKMILLKMKSENIYFEGSLLF